jgi:tetratricopeptide (TPR) repeat protein
LSPGEASQLLINIANFAGERELESFLKTPCGNARVRAIQHLAGGNPRVFVIFSQFLSRKSLNELVEPFMRTLDDLTPHYHARMAWVSPQQRKMVEYLCDRRGAVPVKEIAQHCFMSHQTASGQLKSLREMRYVVAESVGRDSYYDLREPLMRLCLDVKKHQGEPIRLVVEFLRLWYRETALERRLAFLPPPAMAASLELRSSMASAGGDTTGAGVGGRRERPKEAKPAQALLELDELVKLNGSAADWFEHGRCLAQLEREEEALSSFSKATHLDSEQPLFWVGKGWALGQLGRIEAALHAFEKACLLDPGNVPALCNLGISLAKLGRHSEASDRFDMVAELTPEDVRVWTVRACSFAHMRRHEEALRCCEKVLKMGGDTADIWFTRAECLLELRRWDEGIPALREALQRISMADNPSAGDTPRMIYNLLNGPSDPAWRRNQISALVELYEHHQVLSALGQGLVRNIPTLISPALSDLEAQGWLGAWSDRAGAYSEFELPLQLVDAAVRYRKKSDPRILLELPVEYRTLLEPLLSG